MLTTELCRKKAREYYYNNRDSVLQKVKDRTENKPWYKTWNSVHHRCNDKTHSNYKRYGAVGIKNLMSANDFKTLWFRDKAYNMKRPSIDRIDTSGNYELSNCRYLELPDNIRRNWEKNKYRIKINGKFTSLFSQAGKEYT